MSATTDTELQAAPGMGEKIREVARDLLIMHGFQGLRFNDIATALDTTRANIHYHFGTKNNLIDEVIADYLATALKEMGGVWQSELSYEQKILATVELNRARYLRFNPPRSRGGAAWSLISRMRLDAGLLSEAACSRLRDFSRQIESYVQATIERAKADGDLAGTAPTRDIVVQIVSIIDSAGPITQDGGSFDRLEHLYLACMRVIAHAYGSHRKLRGRSVTRDGERIGVALSR